MRGRVVSIVLRDIKGGLGLKRELRIAVDGPSGSGKSSVSKAVATKLGLRYVDTGAMYRAFAVSADENGVAADDEAALSEYAKKAEVALSEDGLRVFVNGKDYTGVIRTEKAGELASRYSSKKVVRERLVGLQQAMAAKQGVVMEGRDIGTVVLKDSADFKFFIDAHGDVRAKRRLGQLDELGLSKGQDIGKVTSDISKRDERDSSRKNSPLVKADDAVNIDTNAMGLEDVVAKIIEHIEKKK